MERVVTGHNYSRHLLARIAHVLITCACVALLSLLPSCQSEELIRETPPTENSDASQYWYTRTRSSEQQSTMLRSHAVGFSYDGIYGEACNQNSVRCQVLNLDILKEKELYSSVSQPETHDNHYSAHSLSECFSKMNSGSKSKTEFLTSKTDAQKVASIFQKREDNVVIISQTRICQAINKNILMDDYHEIQESEKDPYSFLTPSFLYAIRKMQKDNDVAVIDSFIEIFGSHVVTEASVGGQIKLDLTVSTSDIKTLTSEQKITSKAIDFYFKKQESSSSEQTQTFFEGVLKNATLSLNVKGGDIASFGELIANPHSPLRTSDILSRWMNSLDENLSSAWNSRLELVDMKVYPIWEFIPDPKVSARVHARIEATAPTLQELYGNRNFIDVKFSSSVSAVTCKLGGKSSTFNNPWVVDVFAANRHVATLCREWIPEIDPNTTVTVAYPIYENKIQVNAGVCIYGNKAYNVRWLYDQFAVDTLAIGCRPGDMLYMQAGYLQVKPCSPGYKYQDTKMAIGYEWPGSIGIEGGLQNKPFYETRKFLGNFFLNTTAKFSNLPNWIYNTTSLYNKSYDKYLKDNNSTPYSLSGITVTGQNAKEYLSNRMVRSADYTYYYNLRELQW